MSLTDPFYAVLAVMVVLEVKHFVFDYVLQTPYQLLNKGKYGHPGGILHSGLQALGTTAAFLIVTPTLGLAIAIVAGEFVVHYHCDWAKDQINRRIGATAADSQFWWAIGGDQLVHQLTYVVIAGVLVGRTLGT